MKSGIAAMVTATERFLQKHPGHKGSIAFLFTSDEEGPGVDGTQRVLKHLKIKQGAIDYCLVGEPTSVTALGDTIKVGRRGSLSANVTIYGVQGHIAYPHLAVNPIHLFAKPLVELCAKRWDSGNSHFDPTSFQISNVHSGVGVNNVIPANLEFLCNFRYSPQSKAEQLETAVEEILNRHNLEYQIEWSRSSEPFLSKQGQFTEAVQAALKKTCGRPATLSTSGGTSDARFFAPLSAEVLELGSINASMHKLDEHVKIDELNQLSAIYEQILENTLT
jgi:succinyl-diaminopimelate desuccinylase